MSTGERVAPQYCPYCGETDLRPRGESHSDYGSASAPLSGATDRPIVAPWECRSCTRVFTVKFVGMVV
jgi:hypothetical protein